MPTLSGGGSTIQTLKLDAAPSAPYVLTAVVALPPGQHPLAGLRKGATPTAWFPTRKTLIARTKWFDYYELQAYIDSGSATEFELDEITDPSIASMSPRIDPNGVEQPAALGMINADAWALINDPGALKGNLQFIGPNGSLETLTFDLTGGFGNDESRDPEASEKPGRMWTAANVLSNGFGWHRWGPYIRTVYKHIPVQRGGLYGYLHVFVTAMAGTPEVQIELNWHNGGIEERRGRGQVSLADPDSNASTPVDSHGQARARHVIFSRFIISGFNTLPDTVDFGGTWTMTPRLMDGGSPADSSFVINTAGTASHGIVKQVAATNSNERNILPITFERAFRFAVHPSSVTPYLKRKVAMADWSQGGWAFGPLGVPDLTNNPAIDLSAEAATAKTLLRTLQPYSVDQFQTEGMNPTGFFLPGSYSAYGGETAGKGMWPFYGMKAAWTGERDALDLLCVEQLRVHSRTPGMMYGNISGHPFIPTDYANNGERAWRRFDRGFDGQNDGMGGQTPIDNPFHIGQLYKSTKAEITKAAYNPGRIGNSFQGESPSDPTPAVPDWWAGGPGTGGPIAMDGFNGLTPPIELPLSHTQAPNQTDQAVQLIVQISGAGAFNSAKSITVTIEGLGEFGIAATETVVLTGPASGASSIQAKLSAFNYKTITRLAITAASGTFLSTELLTIGRQSIGIPDYIGSGGIGAIDNQHSPRYWSIDMALVLTEWDPIAMLYLMGAGADFRATYWTTGSIANRRLYEVWNGAPGRGANLVRDTAWAIHITACTAALWHGRLEQNVVDAYWRDFFDYIETMFRTMRMPSGLYQVEWGKEFKQVPLGTSSFEEAQQCLTGFSGREQNYFMLALASLVSIKGTNYSQLQQQLAEAGVAYRDYLWKTSGGTGAVIYNYIPNGYVSRNGVIVNPDNGIQASDVVTQWASQAEIPEANPVSGCLLNPAVYPAVDDDRYVAAIAGDALQTAAGTALTLLNAASDTGGPTPVTIKALVAGTYTNQKKRTFRITGTNPLGAYCDDRRFVDEIAGNSIVVGTPLTLLNTTVGNGQESKVEIVVFGGSTFSGKSLTLRIVGTRGNGNSLTEDRQVVGDGQKEQRHRTNNAFATVTSITPIAESGSARVSTEKFRIGTPTRLMVCQGNGASSQTWPSYQHFATVTGIEMLSNAQAARTNNPDQGTLVSSELFRAGTENVGLRQTSTNFPGFEANPLNTENYHVGYALAVLKFFGDLAGDSVAVDECILRFTGQATLEDAMTELETWNEYNSGPGRGEQWYPLLQQLQHAANIAPVADFDAISTSVADGSPVYFRGNLSTGDITTWAWDFGDGNTGSNEFPIHTYAAPGTYDVELTVTGPGGSDVETKLGYITVT